MGIKRSNESVLILMCRMCGYDEEFINGESMCDTNENGWFCDDCDSYNYFDEEDHQKHKFTVILEDKQAKDCIPITDSTRKFKKQLSPFRYPRRKIESYTVLVFIFTRGKM